MPSQSWRNGSHVDELTDSELWNSVEHTIRNVLLPAIPDDEEWAQIAAVQLIGLARYARNRDPIAHDPTELIATLHRLAANPIVAANWQSIRNEVDLDATLGAILAGAVGDDGPDGDEIREQLRPLVVKQMRAELASAEGLLPYFRGQLDQ
jgi:hypothetical protein